MLEPIVKLYDNFCARFKFFRQFIAVLLELNKKLDGQEKSLYECKTSLDSLSERLEEIESKIEKEFVPSDIVPKNAHTIISKYRESLLDINE